MRLLTCKMFRWQMGWPRTDKLQMSISMYFLKLVRKQIVICWWGTSSRATFQSRVAFKWSIQYVSPALIRYWSNSTTKSKRRKKRELSMVSSWDSWNKIYSLKLCSTSVVKVQRRPRKERHSKKNLPSLTRTLKLLISKKRINLLRSKVSKTTNKS